MEGVVSKYSSYIYTAYERVYAKLVEYKLDLKTVHESHHFLSEQLPIIDSHSINPDNLLTLFEPDVSDVYNIVAEKIRHKTPDDLGILNETRLTQNCEWISGVIDGFIEGDDLRPVLHVGPKGSGKTTIINREIHVRNHSFNEHNTLLVRGEAEEYYDIKHDLNLTNLTLDNYFGCCLTNLMVRNKDKFPFESILEGFSTWELCENYQDKVSRSMLKALRRVSTPTVNDMIEVLDSNLNKLKSKGSAKSDNCIYQLFYSVNSSLEKNASPRQYRDWTYFRSLFDEYAASHNINIVYILDGLDNVWALGEKEKTAYLETIDELDKLFEPYKGINRRKNQMITPLRTFYLVNCRGETFQKIVSRSKQPARNEQSLWNFNPEMITVDEVTSILQTKFKLAEASLLGLGNGKTNYSENANRLRKYLKTNHFMSNINMLAQATSTRPEEIFSFNTRGVLYNYLGHALSMTYFLNRAEGEIKELTEYHFFIRNLFFGGRKVLRTDLRYKRNTQKHGIFFPNIFNCGDFMNEDDGTNPVLCALRVIEYLNQNKTEEDKIINFFSETYKYPKKYVSSCLTLMIQFRLIEFVPPRQGNYKAKEKLGLLPAALVLDYIVRNHTDILVYMAFDTVMDEKVADIIFKDISINRHAQSLDYVEMTIKVLLRYVAYLNLISVAEGGTVSFLPIDGYVERISYLLSTLDSYESDTRAVDFIESVSV